MRDTVCRVMRDTEYRVMCDTNLSAVTQSPAVTPAWHFITRGVFYDLLFAAFIVFCVVLRTLIAGAWGGSMEVGHEAVAWSWDMHGAKVALYDCNVRHRWYIYNSQPVQHATDTGISYP